MMQYPTDGSLRQPVQIPGRYARQELLPDIGPEGQARLALSRVVVVGAGGLGSPALLYLAAAGVGSLEVIDSDAVSGSNLNRQLLYAEADLGSSKTEAAVRRLHALNSGISLASHSTEITRDNAMALLGGHDVILDCVDDESTRLEVNRAAIRLGIPLVEAGIDGMSGFVMTVARGTACYACLHPYSPHPASGSIPAFGPAAGVAGSLQAAEAVKLLLGIGNPLYSRVLMFNLRYMEFEELPLPPSPDCPLCGGLEKEE